MNKELFFEVVNQEVSINDEHTEGLRMIVDDFPYFQVAQILYLKSLKETSHPHFETLLKKVAISVPDRKKLYYFLNSKPEVVTDEENGSEEDKQTGFDLEYDEEFQSKDSLIDKFLSSNIGRISRDPEQEEDEQDAENEAIKRSVEEDDEIVTETLATIYLQQKKYDKALNAFRKLSLKYPEKSVYFASRIKEIEDLKNI